MSDDKSHAATRELMEVVRAFGESDLRELSVSSGGIELFLTRDTSPAVANVEPRGASVAAQASSVVPPPPLVETEADAVEVLPHGNLRSGVPGVSAPTSSAGTDLRAVRSPTVGIFFRRPSPDRDPFVEVGSRVSVGEPIGTIEVMKMYTEVPSPVAGVVVEFCVPDGSLVEHDQVIMFVDESN